MRILITGANGFIAREIITNLYQAGHEIIACVRSKHTLLQAFPAIKIITVDFTKPLTEAEWLVHLNNIDIVINCVGVFHTVKESTMWQIHYHAPRALFAAGEKANVKKIIHISALGVDKSDAPYARSKLAIEEYLNNLSVDSVIIRPSFVYGKDCYGGSSLFRGLAATPIAIFLPGQGEQLLQPVHIQDLARIVQEALTLSGKQLLCAAGPEKISLKNILLKMRSWLGFGKAITIAIPILLLKIAAKFGDLIPNSPLSTTGLKLLTIDNVLTEQQEQQLTDSISFNLRGFTQGLFGMTSGVQDRWHARLFLLRPLLRIAIAFIWLFSGLVSLFTANSMGYPLLEQASISSQWQPILLYGGSLVDIVLGVLTLINFRPILIGTLQILLIVIYTLMITFTLPIFWLHPFAPLAKNIPLIVAILIMMSLSSAR